MLAALEAIFAFIGMVATGAAAFALVIIRLLLTRG